MIEHPLIKNGATILPEIDICVIWEIYDYRAKFIIVHSCGEENADIVTARLLAEREENKDNENYSDASIIDGSVKWDGCSNWHAEPIHTCGRDGLEDLTKAMLWCWDFARDNCPKFDK